MTKVYDNLMKSAKLTAAQNKEGNGDAASCVGELIRMCEEQGFIPQYYVDAPKDKVDENILDLKQYIRRLVEEETNLNDLISKSISSIEDEKKNLTSDFAEDTEDEEIILPDYQELAEKEERERLEDEQIGDE